MNLTSSQTLLLWVLAPLFLAWGFFFSQASFFWGSESYYMYGWFVPFLGLVLLYLRLRDFQATQRPLLWALPLILILLGSFLFLQALFQVMPFWRPILWGQVLALLVLSFLWIGFAAGKRAALFFLPVFVYLIIATPWPSNFESDLVHELTMAVAAVTEGVLIVLGYAVTRVNGILNVNGETVYVGDACSGVRSLQALLMIGLFIGELYRLGLARRFLLLMGAGALSFLFNAGRASALSVILVERGPEAYDSWHDPLGGIAYALGAILMIGFAELMGGSMGKGQETPQTETPVAQGWARFIRRSAVWLIIITVSTLAVTEIWFRARSDAPDAKPVWQVAQVEPTGFLSATDLPIDEDVQLTLGYDRAQRVEAIGPHGTRYELYSMEFLSGYMGILAAEHHTPEVCMAMYGGGTILEERSDLKWAVADTPLPVSGYDMLFPQANETRIFAFHGVFISGEEGDAVSRYRDLVVSSHSRVERFRQAFNRLWRGQRHFHVQVFLLGVEGYDDTSEAWEAARDVLDRFLVSPNLMDNPEIAGTSPRSTPNLPDQ